MTENLEHRSAVSSTALERRVAVVLACVVCACGSADAPDDAATQTVPAESTAPAAPSGSTAQAGATSSAPANAARGGAGASAPAAPSGTGRAGADAAPVGGAGAPAASTAAAAGSGGMVAAAPSAGAAGEIVAAGSGGSNGGGTWQWPEGKPEDFGVETAWLDDAADSGGNAGPGDTLDNDIDLDLVPPGLVGAADTCHVQRLLE